VAYPTWLNQVELANVVVSDNAGYGIVNSGSYDISIENSNIYNNASGEYSGVTDPTGSEGNISVDPDFVAFSSDGDPDLWDLHLAPSSPLIDGGDPSLTDPDGSTSDMGAYGGPDADFDYYTDGDADGLYDGWEDAYGLDTSSDDSADDTDGDSLTNAEEFAEGTDPSSTDTDSDGVDDYAELASGTDPLDSGSY